MPDQSNSHFTEPVIHPADMDREASEYLQSPVYQVFEKWEEEKSAAATRVPPGMLRPWCGSRFLYTVAFDLALTTADKQFLSELLIRS